MLVGIVFRRVTGPLVTHFDTATGDTHGFARFATDREKAPFTRFDTGLLIGRDRGTGRQLCYDWLTHLLTMAPTRAGTFLSNAGVFQVVSVNEYDPARLVADLLGQETIVLQTMSRALYEGLSISQHHIDRPCFLAGQRPIAAAKLAYYADLEFSSLFGRR